jgi:hypothetical protein
LRDAAFPADQVIDFNTNVRPHLDFVFGDNTVNPREVKRLINTYVLQMKMLAPRLQEALDPNVVLALQCLSVREDWGELYNHLAADPLLFQETIERQLKDHRRPEPPTSVWMPGVKVALPSEVVDYLLGPGAPLLKTPDLWSYVLAAESTYSSDPSILDAQSLLSQIRRSVEELPTSEDPKLPIQINSRLSRMLKIVDRWRKTDPKLRTNIEAVIEQINKLTAVAEEPGVQPARWAIATQEAIEQINTPIEELDRRLRDLRRRANIGASA